jgi:hypothetical protein
MVDAEPFVAIFPGDGIAHAPFIGLPAERAAQEILLPDPAIAPVELALPERVGGFGEGCEEALDLGAVDAEGRPVEGREGDHRARPGTPIEKGASHGALAPSPASRSRNAT